MRTQALSLIHTGLSVRDSDPPADRDALGSPGGARGSGIKRGAAHRSGDARARAPLWPLAAEGPARPASPSHPTPAATAVSHPSLWGRRRLEADRIPPSKPAGCWRRLCRHSPRPVRRGSLGRRAPPGPRGRKAATLGIACASSAMAASNRVTRWCAPADGADPRGGLRRCCQLMWLDCGSTTANEADFCDRPAKCAARPLAHRTGVD